MLIQAICQEAALYALEKDFDLECPTKFDVTSNDNGVETLEKSRKTFSDRNNVHAIKKKPQIVVPIRVSQAVAIKRECSAELEKCFWCVRFVLVRSSNPVHQPSRGL